MPTPTTDPAALAVIAALVMLIVRSFSSDRSLWDLATDGGAWVSALGIGFALMSIGRRRAGKPMHPDAAKADVGLLVFGGLMVIVGVIRWSGA